jgi:hypothetical protein
MKKYGGVEVQLHHSEPSLDGGEWAASCPKDGASGAYLIGGWVDAVGQRKISCPCQELNPSHPAHSAHLHIECAI